MKLTYIVNKANDCLQILDSYNVSKRSYDFVIDDVFSKFPSSDLSKHLSKRFIANKWAACNFMYHYLGIHLNKLKHVRVSANVGWIWKSYWNLLGSVMMKFVK